MADHNETELKAAIRREFPQASEAELDALTKLNKGLQTVMNKQPDVGALVRGQGITEEFRNDTDMEFVDISSEEYREYQFENVKIVIPGPLWLHVSASGGHRIFDRFGTCHYIAPKWLTVHWRSFPGTPHFVR